jgi:GNAT superfamily N-acetyltransferase
MIMTEPPTPPEDSRIFARRIETLAEVIEGLRIDAAATGLADDELDALLEAAPDLFEAERRDGHLTFLAFDETEMPIGMALAFVSPFGLELAAASTLPDHRGRGAYRALVHARWLEAVRRGTPALAVQAGANSRPILERLGFETVCTLHAVTDQATL